MNPLQTDSFNDGMKFVRTAFAGRTRLDLAQLTGWINTCLSGDRTKHSQKALHEIDADDNLVASTTFEIGKAEAAGYRLLGALTAVEDIRHDLIQRNINFSFKGIP